MKYSSQAINCLYFKRLDVKRGFPPPPFISKQSVTQIGPIWTPSKENIEETVKTQEFWRLSGDGNQLNL